MTALETGQWESQRSWKDIFATEVATRIERSYLKVWILYCRSKEVVSLREKMFHVRIVAGCWVWSL